VNIEKADEYENNKN
jgi:hypothetical protein